MFKTPDLVSKRRQELRHQISIWETALTTLLHDTGLKPEDKMVKVPFVRQQLADARREMQQLLRKGPYWPWAKK
jgi:hypothetical protein